MIEALRHIDQTLFHFINHDLANPFFDILFKILRGKIFLGTFYAVVLVSLWQFYPGQFFKIVLFGAITFLLTDQTSAHLIKSIIHRIRPCNNTAIPTRLIVDACGSGFSFVSAHAANSFGIAAFLSVILPRKRGVIIILGTWASLVSFAQVYVGVHFPADVIGGAMLGVILGAAVGFVAKAKFELNPQSKI